jgi:short-subunit dehydrogenase
VPRCSDWVSRPTPDRAPEPVIATETPRSRPVALVTGASSGFGTEFAHRFAARGYDLVLVARRRDRLEALAADLSSRHGVTATVLTADLADPAAPAALVAALAAQQIRVDALVNNAGFGTYGPFLGEDPARIADEVQVNVAAVTVLSRLLLPDLVAAPRGILLNVASTAAYQPAPSIAVYSATKAYVRALTEGIWQEHRGTSLRVLTLCPGPTETEFFQAAGSEGFKVGQMLTVPQVVDVAFRALDRRNAPPSVVAGWRNKATAVAVGLLPRRLVLGVAARLMGDG